MSNDINDFLLGGGGKAAKFENLGDFVEGEITSVELTQQTDMEHGTPLTWADGSPRKQLVIAMKTDQSEGRTTTGSARSTPRAATTRPPPAVASR